MARPQSIWQLAEPDDDACRELAAELGISELIAKVLYNRGIHNGAEAQEFINCAMEHTPDPLLLKDMHTAVGHILAALENGDKILVYGDYDVDGITSTALLLDVLEALGGKPGFHIPDRQEEGYGLNPAALQQAAAQGYKLIISVDCGISAVNEARYAAELGLQLVITDHHQPPPELPRALAIINPKQPGCAYPFKDLAGVGVCFKLAQALIRASALKVDTGGMLDLVTLGTVADIVPLVGENRTLVKHGLDYLAKSARPGVQALLQVAGLGDKQLTAGHVGFALAPRINASGRIGDASIAVQLLRTNDALRAREMAVYLDAENRERQELEATTLAQALDMLTSDGLSRDKVMVLAGEGWHPGVIGIVASRVVERFYRPVIIIALDGEEGKGSARSIPGFDMYEALSRCQNLLLKFGGHKQAAGIALKRSAVGMLRQALNSYADTLDKGLYLPRLRIDAAVALDQLDAQLVEDIKSLEPFGFGNPSPVFTLEQLQLVEAREVGKDKNHLKVRFKDDWHSVDGIGFGLVPLMQDIRKDKKVNVAFTPELNEYKGRTTIQLLLKDMQNCNLPPHLPILRYYDRFSGSELHVLEQLALGKDLEVTGNLAPLFPLLAAANQAMYTGLPSLVVYPLRQIVDQMLSRNGSLFSQLGMQIVVNPVVPCTADLFVLSWEFFDQNMAKIMESKQGAIIIDTIERSLPAREGTPLLKTYTSDQIVNNYAPSRERLLRLYQALRRVAQPAGRQFNWLVDNLSVGLAEPREFVEKGLEIFAEISIIQQEISRNSRIIYFRAPRERLNLSDSSLYSAAQGLVVEFTRLKGQCS